VPPLPRTVLLDALTREAAAFRAVLATADLDSAVPACPDWDLRELAAHVAGVHRWALNAVADGELRRDPTPPLPDRAAVETMYADAVTELIAALRRAPDDAPCPSFLTPDDTARFWLRRQVHELLVHRYDAEHATGAEPVLDTELAADGVAEALEVFLPRMRARGLLGDLPATLTLRQSDGPGEWVLSGGPQQATVVGPAQDLLLLLWKRRPLDGLEVHGDEGVARAVLSCALTP
jgi:uncharacterized protein (TIGR03083 family)